MCCFAHILFNQVNNNNGFLYCNYIISNYLTNDLSVCRTHEHTVANTHTHTQIHVQVKSEMQFVIYVSIHQRECYVRNCWWWCSCLMSKYRNHYWREQSVPAINDSLLPVGDRYSSLNWQTNLPLMMMANNSSLFSMTNISITNTQTRTNRLRLASLNHDCVRFAISIGWCCDCCASFSG